MKKLIFLLSFLLGSVALYSQSELPSDTIRRLPPNVKQYGEFLIDMGLFAASTPKLPKLEFKLTEPATDYNQLFSLNPDITFTQGFTQGFHSPYSWGFGFGSSPQYLQMSTFKLKNGMKLSTFGEYDAHGRKVPNPSALPWEKNNFKGGFELKSENGAFGIRIEVQQGRNAPYPY